MNRREFVRLAGAGVSAGALAEAMVSAQVARTPATSGIVAPTTSPRVRMKVGTQHGHSDAVLRACAAFGVNNICSSLPSAKMDEAWSVDSLSKLRELVASHGISLDMVPLLTEDEKAVDALAELSAPDANRGLVVDHGQLAGLLSITDLVRALEVGRRPAQAGG